MITQDDSLRLLTPRTYGTVAQTGGHPELALENVNTSQLFDGTLCMVGGVPNGAGGLFRLDKTSVVPLDSLNVLPTQSGVGRWRRVAVDSAASQVNIRSSLGSFNEVLIPPGTLEADPVIIHDRFITVLTSLGYANSYFLDARASLWGSCLTAMGTTVTAGMKFQWDIAGDGTWVDGARVEGMNMIAGAEKSLVLIERRQVSYATIAAAGVAQLMRLVGWDAEQDGGWSTAIGGGGIGPNTLEMIGRNV